MSPGKNQIVDTDELELGTVARFHPQRIAASDKAVISTAHHGATDAGARILAEGGNVVDAACAAAFALGVCEPAASGLGGQTIAVVRIADRRRTFALDGSSRAPNRVEPGELPKADRLHGHRASTVPATPAVLEYLLRQYGTCSLAQVLQPSIELAQEGYDVSELQHRLARRELKHLRRGSAGQLFLRDGVRPYAVGARFKQPALATTLRRLARRGIEDFYTGKIAKAIAADMTRNHGFIRLDDLAQVPLPIERKTVRGRLGPHRVHTMPPPAAGSTLIELINIVSSYSPKRFDLSRPEGTVLLVEAIRHAFMDRRDRPFDPNYYHQVDNKRALSVDYAQSVARSIQKRIAGSGETTHLSVMDVQGNAVALTQSIERVYGSCAASPELGFLYNNYLSAFEYTDIAHPYYLRPNAVPWASVAPTVVFRGNTPWIAIGSPGSERITSSILQVLLRLGAMGPLGAVTAPRVHCSVGGRVSLEATRMRDDVVPLLERRGYSIDIRDPFSFYLGCVQLAMRDGGQIIGVADPRRDGSASGPRAAGAP